MFSTADSHKKMILCNDTLYCKRCVAVPGQNYSWYINETKYTIYLPAQGDKLILNKACFYKYRRCIEYETRQPLSLRGDTVLLGDSVVRTYRFRHDYYFMRGDNFLDSYDSRFWGPLPDDFILGVGQFIWFSRNPDSGEIRWERMFRKL